MKVVALLLLLNLAFMAGCAQRYIITLDNGNQITAHGKPVLKDGAYYFKNASGTNAALAAGRVSLIEPASRKGNKSSGFLPPPR